MSYHPSREVMRALMTPEQRAEADRREAEQRAIIEAMVTPDSELPHWGSAFRRNRGRMFRFTNGGKL